MDAIFWYSDSLNNSLVSREASFDNSDTLLDKSRVNYTITNCRVCSFTIMPNFSFKVCECQLLVS